MESSSVTIFIIDEEKVIKQYSSSPNAVSYDEMKQMVHHRIEEIVRGDVASLPHNQVMTDMKLRYGL